MARSKQTDPKALAADLMSTPPAEQHSDDTLRVPGAKPVAPGVQDAATADAPKGGSSDESGFDGEERISGFDGEDRITLPPVPAKWSDVTDMDPTALRPPAAPIPQIAIPQVLSAPLLPVPDASDDLPRLPPDEGSGPRETGDLGPTLLNSRAFQRLARSSGIIAIPATSSHTPPPVAPAHAVPPLPIPSPPMSRSGSRPRASGPIGPPPAAPAHGASGIAAPPIAPPPAAAARTTPTPPAASPGTAAPPGSIAHALGARLPPSFAVTETERQAPARSPSRDSIEDLSSLPAEPDAFEERTVRIDDKHLGKKDSVPIAPTVLGDDHEIAQRLQKEKLLKEPEPGDSGLGMRVLSRIDPESTIQDPRGAPAPRPQSRAERSARPPSARSDSDVLRDLESPTRPAFARPAAEHGPADGEHEHDVDETAKAQRIERTETPLVRTPPAAKPERRDRPDLVSRSEMSAPLVVPVDLTRSALDAPTPSEWNGPTPILEWNDGSKVSAVGELFTPSNIQAAPDSPIAPPPVAPPIGAIPPPRSKPGHVPEGPTTPAFPATRAVHPRAALAPPPVAAKEEPPRPAAPVLVAPPIATAPVPAPAQKAPERGPSQLKAGEFIPDLGSKYRVTGNLGEGGLAIVYEAEHIGLRRQVAVKVLHRSSADEPELVERLRREAEAASKIRHPGIVEALDFDWTADGRPYLVMERLVGEDLRARLKARTRIGVSEVAAIGIQVCDALAATHKHGIIHRDIKPENVFLTLEDGGRLRVKLLDFGAAWVRDAQAITMAGTLVGTPAYVAPEQLNGNRCTELADVYGTALVMYEALTGAQPFTAQAFAETLARVLHHVPARPTTIGAPPNARRLEDVLLRGLEKEPSARWPSALALKAAIEDATRPPPKTWRNLWGLLGNKD